MSDEPYNDTGKTELLDRIAMIALKVFLQSGQYLDAEQNAKDAYAVADAMLKARERKPQ